MLTIVALLMALTGAGAAPVNLVGNAGFETGLEAWEVGFGAAPQIDLAEKHSGAASARIAVVDTTSALDATPLAIGYDVDPQTTYRVSAWLKNGGVTQGGFGGRVYFHDAGGEYMQMLTFGNIGPNSAVGDWQQYSIELKPGTETAIPAGAATVKLRFSIWAQDQKCAGKVWVDDVEFVPVNGTGAGAPPAWLKMGEKGTALVLSDDLPPAGTASEPQGIADMLRTAGMEANLVSGKLLAEAGVLNPRWVDLLVLPYGEAYPADARDAIAQYATHGGSFLSLGGLAFERPMRKLDDEWLAAGEIALADDDAAQIADMEGDQKPEWDLAHRSAQDEVVVAYDAPGASGTSTAARLDCVSRAFCYAGIEDIAAEDAEQSVLSFWAKGDGETPQLAVELREEDGSRWKRVVRLSEDWQLFALQNTHFMAYDSEGRGGAGDAVDPCKVAGVWFGMTRGMNGEGERTVWLDEIQWRRVLRDAGPLVAPLRPSAEADLTMVAFGSSIAQAPQAAKTLPVFTPVKRFEKASSLRLAGGRDLRDRFADGEFSGYLATAPVLPLTSPGQRPPENRLGSPPMGRLVPLLEAVGGDGETLGVAAAAYFPLAAHARGSVWAFSGVEDADVARVEHFEDILHRVALAAMGQPRIGRAEVTFGVEDGRAAAKLNVELLGDTAQAGKPQVTARVVSVEGERLCEKVEDVTSSSLAISAPELSAMRLDYRVEVGLTDGDTLIDELSFEVDAEKRLMELVDWLVDNQADDGTFSGIAFEDNRAVRGLLGAYEISGKERYRVAGVRWGEEMMRLQREDGGYRMGYGIGRKGEACYVADGGEIAIAMARLVSYTHGEQRQRFIDSLGRYMGYRESFREDNGAIGVGWCLHDYSKRPIEPLETPERIYAGEKNAYTIGCTLAAATAYARITGGDADLQMALADTDWLLEHYSSYSGAAAESAFWAHHYIADADLQARIVEELREGLRKRVVSEADRSWLGGGGRSVLDLDAISYWLAEIDPDDAEMQAAFGRWLYALCGTNSTSSVAHLLEAEGLTGVEKRFIDFLAVALADAVRPVVSMKDF